MPNNNKISRKEQILGSLASMLESCPGERITTAALAKRVGVSEAALYRHFPSKTKMFESLIKFIEETLFLRVSRIIKEEQSAHANPGAGFSPANPHGRSNSGECGSRVCRVSGAHCVGHQCTVYVRIRSQRRAAGG